MTWETKIASKHVLFTSGWLQWPFILAQCGRQCSRWWQCDPVFPAGSPLVIWVLRVFDVRWVMRSAIGMCEYWLRVSCPAQFLEGSFVTTHISTATCYFSRNNCHLYALCSPCIEHKSLHNTRSSAIECFATGEARHTSSLASRFTVLMCSALSLPHPWVLLHSRRS